MLEPRLYVAGDALNPAQSGAKPAPSPVHRIVGTLSQTHPVSQALAMESFAA
jgi:hypothetical protein